MISKKQILQEAKISHLNYVRGQYGIITVEWRGYTQLAQSTSTLLKDFIGAIEKAGDLLYAQVQNEFTVLLNQSANRGSAPEIEA